MKILHTADWHLGKKLYNKSRIEEQEQVLNEILNIANAEKVDAIVLAGDVFDNFVPTSEAEELFYKYAVKLSRDRVFIAISGNHDDGDRLKSPDSIAKACDIFLIGECDSKTSAKNISNDCTYSRRDNMISIKKGQEELEILCYPFPFHAKICLSGEGDIPYQTLVEKKLSDKAKDFNKDNFNMLVSHLFMSGSDTTDERTLGTASILSKTIIPENDYTALGHVHKPQVVSKSKNIFYSGSILQYHFDDTTKKSVNIIEFTFKNNKKMTSVKKVELISGKSLVTVKVASFIEAEKALSENENNHVYLIYDGNQPLAASEFAVLKKMPAYTYIENQYKPKNTKKEFKQRSDKDMFVDFYFDTYGEKPNDDIVSLFLEVLEQEDKA